ncbi:hypothetical protein ACH47C_26925 [Streptomyces rishiriensis]|uniref:hypothetical protein n=1 Tax=Streptomyces rishiriensis TaxID=68264 RepID=UPI0033D18605
MTMADGTITARGLQAAVALTTARSAGLDIPQAQLLGDTPAEEALLALTVLASCFLDFGAPSAPRVALRTAGGIAGRLEVQEGEDR